MKVKFGQTYAEAWEVSRDTQPVAFVQELLDKGQLVWKKDPLGPLLRIPAIEEHHKGEYLGELLAMRLRGVGEIVARPGEYLVQWNDGTLRVVTAHSFLKDYQMLE